MDRPTLNNSTAIEAIRRAPGAILTYLTLIATPWQASPSHGLSAVPSIASQAFYLPVAELIGLAVLAWLLLGHHPHRRLYLYCSGWFLVALSPTLNLLAAHNSESVIHDRYLYLPSLGICVTVADLSVYFARQNRQMAWAVKIAVAAILIAYAGMLYTAEHYWHDDVSLFTRAVETAPNEELWQNRLGVALADRGDYVHARPHFEIAHKIDPNDGWNLYNLGRTYEETGDAVQAERDIVEGLKRIDKPPQDAYSQLAITATVAGDPKTAQAALARAEKVPGGFAVAASARAEIAFWNRDYGGAEAAIRSLLKQDPENAEALTILGRALTEQHRDDEALAVLRHVASILPPNSGMHYIVAFGLYRLGDLPGARKECDLAIVATPSDSRVRALKAAIERGGA
ncbi:MAG TPA: tetratricopeptide repeat protein [Candidatus Binataceae bacterium]|nr:tetratricopeptide repeat protein [Candidatus Binataceae bacterium]